MLRVIPQCSKIHLHKESSFPQNIKHISLHFEYISKQSALIQNVQSAIQSRPLFPQPLPQPIPLHKIERNVVGMNFIFVEFIDAVNAWDNHSQIEHPRANYS